MMESLIAALAVVGSMLTGRSLLALFDRVCGTRETARPAAEVWGMSILLGVTFTSASGFVWSDMGRVLGPHFSWRQVILGGMFGIIATVRSGKWTAGVQSTLSPPPHFPVIRICQVVLSLVVGGAFVFTVLNTQPAGRERASIESKAEILYETQTIDAPALVTPPVILSTARDPLMLPLFERHVYALLGSVSHRWARIWSPMAYAGLLLSFAGILGRRTSAARGWLTATALSLTPVMISRESGVMSALSEIPTTCFHGAAVLCLWDAWQAPPGRERIRAILLASGMASSACFVQNEGVTLLVIDCVTWCLAALGGGVRLSGDRPDEGLRPRGSRHLFAIVLFAMFAAILLTPWMRYRASLPSTRAWLGPAVLKHIETPIPSTNLTRRITDLPQRLIQEWWSWPFSGWLLLFAVLGRPRRSWAEPQRFLLLSLLSSATVLILMWAMAPEGLKELMGPVSHRSVIPLVPVAILFVASVWRAPPVTPRDRP